MERIFFVENGWLDEVNEWLQKGGRVKMIQVAATGDSGSQESYAYVVVEFD